MTSSHDGDATGIALQRRDTLQSLASILFRFTLLALKLE